MSTEKLNMIFSRLLILAVAFSATLAASAAHWWEEGISRFVSIQTGYAGPDKFDPAAFAARKAELGFNAERLSIMGRNKGLDDQGFFFLSSLAGKTNEDYLRRYLPEAKKRGLRVTIYFDVHDYNAGFTEQHRDWMQQNEDGSMPRIYDTGYSPCVNSPFRDWVFQVMRNLAAYSLDGIFFDGPIYFADSCYCPHCLHKWERLHPGKPLPSKKAHTGNDFRDLIEFQAQSIADFLHDARQAVKTINPEIAVYMNNGVRGANWASGRLNRVLIEEEDILGGEGGYFGGDMTRLSLWKPGLNARLFETQSGGKPRQVFTAASHKPWTFSMLPSAELRLSFFDSIANAAACSFAFTPPEMYQPETQTMAELNRFIERNQRYYTGTHSEARTALVWSDVTANFYAGAAAQMIDIDRLAARSEIGNLDAEFSGLAEALVRSHTPFDVLDDVALERDPLDRFRTIVLPNVACMSDSVAARLAEWVRDGGTLIATFETSRYGDTGLPRTNFALATMFGADSENKIAGPMPHDFMKPMGPVSGIDRELVQATIYHVAVRSTGAKVRFQFMKPLTGRYDGDPVLGDDPALLVNSFGSGHVVYCSGDLGNCIQTFHIPEHLDLLSPWFASPITVSNAPGSVEVVLRSQENGGRWLLHLVNASGEMTRPMRRILPVHDITIQLPPNAPAHKVRAIRAGKSIKPGRRLNLGTLNDYELLVIE